jgi:voltage-gated potassium channel
MNDDATTRERNDRWAVLRDLEGWLEKPMVVLSAIWLGLLIVELTQGLSPGLEIAGGVIWAIFVLDFVLRLMLVPEKAIYLRNNLLTAISLVVPALRILRALRAMRALSAARAVRSFRLVKVVGTLNRGMRALGRTFARRGFGYVVALTIVVVLAGAAGILAFERAVAGSPIHGYWDAVWWTAMVMTTMGSDYFPKTPEGRFLCVLLALYAFAVFGYVTATLATFFIDRDASDPRSSIANDASLVGVHAELQAIRAELAAMNERA